MQENVLIVVEQAVNKCLEMDLSQYKQIELIVGAAQKTMPVEFVKELLKIQSKSGIPIELLATKGSGSHHVEMYLAWLLGRHIEKLGDGNITVIANNIDADSLLDTCVDEEYRDRISIWSDDSTPVAAPAKAASTKGSAEPAAKKAEMELVPQPEKSEAAAAEEDGDTKQMDSKLISKLMQKKEILEARHPITGEPLPDPLQK